MKSFEQLADESWGITPKVGDIFSPSGSSNNLKVYSIYVKHGIKFIVFRETSVPYTIREWWISAFLNKLHNGDYKKIYSL